MSSFLQDSQYNSNRANSYLPPRQAYSFPTLKTDEIVKCLNELGITTSQEEIQNPDQHREACRRMLESLAEICTGISKEELTQPSFAGLQNVVYPELHEESIPKFNQFKAVCKMMEICEIPDFTIKDFMGPTKNRLRLQLSGIINFAKFREERLTLLSELSTNREALVDQLSQLRERNETLNNRLALLREQTAEETNIIVGLESECRDIEANISAMNHSQVKMKEESAQLKSSLSELKENITYKSQLQEELQAQRKQLSMQIVSSPEKFRKQIYEVGQTLDNERKETKNAEKKLKELNAWISNIDDAQEEVRAAVDAIVELRTEVDKQKSVIMELENQKQEIEAKRVAYSELEQNVYQVQRNAGRAEEKLQHLRKQIAMRGSESQTAVEELHKQLVDAEAFRLQVSRDIDGLFILCNPCYRFLRSVHEPRDNKVKLNELNRK